jgi:cyclic pyranopterin monophosphate synthase
MIPFMEPKLSHFDAQGRAKMVDVGAKDETLRIAIARSLIEISPELTAVLETGRLEKGDAFTVAKTAGILAAKQTGMLIPLCHPLGLDYVGLEIDLIGRLHQVRIEAEARTTARTGVEMEAMMAVSIAGLTFYDMCKAVDKGIRIVRTGLYRKSGGKSGAFHNPALEWP